jgi:uncharacterized protein (DUF362 family)
VIENVFISGHDFDLSFIDVRPGDWVVIKPNLVSEGAYYDKNQWDYVITSPKLIKDVCEYVCQRLNGKGKITLCDAPQTDSSFPNIAQKTKLFEIAELCNKTYGIVVEVVDLRNQYWINESGIIAKRQNQEGDPRGAIRFNLGKDSLFYSFQGEGHYYGADYDDSVVNKHHQGKIQEYLISATPVVADVFINLPKLKTHMKTGVTLSLKNLVGINADKNWLPHYTKNAHGITGDQYPTHTTVKQAEQSAVHFAHSIAQNMPVLGVPIAQLLRKIGAVAFGKTGAVIRSGNWYGNDTVWRMVLDLNRCLLYGNEDGTLRDSNPKRYYTLIDGIIGMEGDGPTNGTPIDSGVIICGKDPVATDIVAAKFMGLDWNKIPLLREAFATMRYPITSTNSANIFVTNNILGWTKPFSQIENETFFRFSPSKGWKGHIECPNINKI